NSCHFAIFSGWIDKKEYKVKKSSYSFNLLYRASRDGNTNLANSRVITTPPGVFPVDESNGRGNYMKTKRTEKNEYFLRNSNTVAAFFSSWIDKKKYNNKKKPYDFKLLYRASRDGNTAAAFHQKCDNKGANIVVVKIKGTEQINKPSNRKSRYT
ncbi:15856_t:CDS:2, partial [Funneliformis geosporum]